MEITVKPSTVGPILKGGLDDTSIGVWVRGSGCSSSRTFICVRLNDEHTVYKEVSAANDYIDVFHFNDLSPGLYKYEAGYFHTVSFDVHIELLDWKHIIPYRFTIDPYAPLDFVFGSCRRLIEMGPITFGTRNQGDEIFNAIYQQEGIQFVMNIGDKVYYDPLGKFGRLKRIDDMRRLNRRVFNFPHQRQLYQNIPGYDICDDHDLHMNDCGEKTRTKHPQSFANGLKVYQEYQHHSGPQDSIGEPLYYSFTKCGSHFYIMDTRSERHEISEPPYFISDEQEADFVEWITDPAKRDQYKFVVSSVPLISQIESDSWSGVPCQQRRILEAILGKDAEGMNINHVVLLVGDAHCARMGIYKVYNKSRSSRPNFSKRKGKNKVTGKHLGDIPEILSSGLVAINHDQGKPLTRYDNISYYDIDNNFPHTIDHTSMGGLKFVTSMSTPCFPNPHAPQGILEPIQSLFQQVIDNTFVRITEMPDDGLQVTILNQKGTELHNVFFQP